MTSFVVTGSTLHDAAAWASRATPAKPTAPVLAGLLLDAGEHLTLSGFDYDTCATVRISATTTEPGRLLVSAKLLVAIAKSVARDVNVTISDVGGAVELACGRSEWTLPALPAHDYPTLPTQGEPVGAVDAAVLRTALARVLPAVSHDANLAMLTGVKVEGDATGLTLVATDRFRLAAADIEWTPKGDALDVLVPATLLDAASRGVTDASGPVTLSATAGGFGLSTDTHRLTGRLLAEQYPRWRSLIPTEPGGHHATVDVAELLDALGQVQAIATVDADKQLRFGFSAEGVEISATGDGRRARAACTAELVGDDIEVAVKADYLRDAMAGCGTEHVRLHFGATPTKPILICPVDGHGYRHLVVPVSMPAARRAVA